MKTVIYLDILLLVNFLIGYFLLRAAGLLTGGAGRPGRLLLGAVVAAGASLALLLPRQPLPVQFGYQLASALAVVWCAFGRQSPRMLARRVLWYALLNVLLAGAVGYAVLRGGLRGAHTNNLAVYFNISPGLLVGCMLAVYLVIRLLSLLFGPPQPAGGWVLELELAGTVLRLDALYDTGYFLRDPLSGGQTVLLSFPQVRAQLPEPLQAYLAAWFAGDAAALAHPPPGASPRPILCRTAAGEELLPGFRAARLRLSRGGRVAESRAVTAAFCRGSFEQGGAAALFGSELLTGLP